MKLSKILPFIAIIVVSSLTLGAQQYAKYENVTLERLKDATGHIEKIRISMNIDLSTISLKSKEMLLITPQISSDDRVTVLTLPMVVVAGNNRYSIVRRNIALKNMPKSYDPSSEIYRYKDVHGTKIHYSREIPYKEWMRKSNAGISESITGCASCVEPIVASPVKLGNLSPVPYQTFFATAYIAPKVETKQRSEKLEAFFNYKVARYELLRDYKGNASEFRRVDEFMKGFFEDANVTVSDYAIDGYASPEGTFKSNITLSQNRAKTFASYLKKTYGIADGKMRVEGHGEDWEGLRRAVEKSNLSNKKAIVSIIDKYSTDVERERAISKLDGGNTYTRLLKDIYPPLRRNTLSVSYVIKGFNLEEALEAYHSKPHQLSEEEFFRVSQTFKKGGEDFVDVFMTAVKYYPESQIANLNTGAAYIEAGNFMEAEAYLLKAGDTGEAINNLAIVYFNKGDYTKARSEFERALKKGFEDAAKNIQELDKFEESMK